jgi:hypothetical protein
MYRLPRRGDWGAILAGTRGLHRARAICRMAGLAYWTGIPPDRRPGIRRSGKPIRKFFEEYWDEICRRRGMLLCAESPHDLSAALNVALALGLVERDWESIVLGGDEISGRRRRAAAYLNSRRVWRVPVERSSGVV